MNTQTLSLFDPTDPVDFISDLRARINLGLSSCSKEDLADAIEQLADELAPRLKWDGVVDSVERNVDTDPDKAESELDEIFGAKEELYALRSKVELLKQELAVKSAFDDALAEIFAGPVANDGGSHIGLVDYCGVCTVGHGDVGEPCERHGVKIPSWRGWIVVDQTRTILGAFQSNAPWDPRTFKRGNDAFHNAQSLAKILSAIGPVYVVEARGECDFRIGSTVLSSPRCAARSRQDSSVARGAARRLFPKSCLFETRLTLRNSAEHQLVGRRPCGSFLLEGSS